MMVFSQTWMKGKLWKVMESYGKLWKVETEDPESSPSSLMVKKCKKHPWISGEDFPI
jgi:hypothetical protein